jgi:uncharacterized repeat protein (TIGR01451 family)
MRNHCRKSHLKMRFGPGAFLACGVLAASALAWQAVADQQDLSATLKAWKIVKKDGKEARVAADNLGTGEILEYQAVYKNNSSKTLTGIQATLPIPKGLELVPGTIAPKVAQASTDGKKFSAIPLRRTVQVGGVSKEVPVPYSEYRSLRWSIASLKPKQSVTVSARAKLAR